MQHRLPVVAPLQLARTAGQLGGQAVVLLAAAVAEAGGVEVEQLPLAQQPAVPLLAQRPIPGGFRPQLVQEGGVGLERGGGLLPRLGEARAQRRVADLRGQQLAGVARPRQRLVAGAVQQDLRHQLGAQVAPPVVEVAGDRPQPGGRIGHQVGLRAEPVEEQEEDAVQAGVQVRVGLAPPHLPVVHDVAPAQRRQHQVAVHLLVEGQVVGVDGVEPAQPLPSGPGASHKGRLGQVVKLRVVVGETQGGGLDRRLGVLLVEELTHQLREGGQGADPPTVRA